MPVGSVGPLQTIVGDAEVHPKRKLVLGQTRSQSGQVTRCLQGLQGFVVTPQLQQGRSPEYVELELARVRFDSSHRVTQRLFVVSSGEKLLSSDGEPGCGHTGGGNRRRRQTVVAGSLRRHPRLSQESREYSPLGEDWFAVRNETRAFSSRRRASYT